MELILFFLDVISGTFELAHWQLVEGRKSFVLKLAGWLVLVLISPVVFVLGIVLAIVTYLFWLFRGD